MWVNTCVSHLFIVAGLRNGGELYKQFYTYVKEFL